MPQKTCSSKKIRHRFAAPRCATLFVAAIVSAAGDAMTAHAQRNRRPAPQGTQTTGAGQQQTQQPTRPQAKLTPLRTSETSQGSRLTITSTNALSDYSAYRSGDKFYVVIPNADANAVRGGARGRGFEGADVQKRGNDVVLSFKLKPGSKPRVNQRFNQLDVVFARGGEGTAAQRRAPRPADTAGQTQNSSTNGPQPQPRQGRTDDAFHSTPAKSRPVMKTPRSDGRNARRGQARSHPRHTRPARRPRGGRFLPRRRRPARRPHRYTVAQAAPPTARRPHQITATRGEPARHRLAVRRTGPLAVIATSCSSASDSSSPRAPRRCPAGAPPRLAVEERKSPRSKRSRPA